ncbi:DsbA family protein [Peribacillus frigoritolerans]|jgi:protein-disulfide isomerase|uniref:DsbA family protein n=1 Tax=Peribacillus TaxID=2675229 RepID=UPI0006BF1A60|nr:thioredoxin domain-containing protein [Peribacillus frigoritolerans]KOR85620.1 thiol-disulfide oxidoreductase [Bacillus sp. FJAT-22058]AZV62498.1 thiol-disulfide oxidoreductase [Peribacillus frigoritolerans]MDM5308562.1 thioredoxin domain-containing protein [Peribacillus frigoritolerans]MDM5312193.1 thioredoxin domain-containing protein [Peribacillus frigoritolerans]MED4688262.1 thioredoxin domain-containing protein [Peribacillus frigoritolerans]
MANKKKGNQKQSSAFTFWIIGLIAVIIIGFIFLANGKKDEDTAVNEIDYKSQPYLGEKSAPVQIVEFGDYKCPVCKTFEEQFFPSIQSELIDTGKAQFYFMNYSFINVDSTRSAKFAESVYQELGNETFWKFHELLFDKQPADLKYEKEDVFTDKFLEETLKEIANDKDVKKVVTSFKAKKSEDQWNKDMELADELGVTGTPSLFVNGKKFEGNTIDDLVKMVDDAAKEK